MNSSTTRRERLPERRRCLTFLVVVDERSVEGRVGRVVERVGIDRWGTCFGVFVGETTKDGGGEEFEGFSTRGGGGDVDFFFRAEEDEAKRSERGQDGRNWDDGGDGGEEERNEDVQDRACKTLEQL